MAQIESYVNTAVRNYMVKFINDVIFGIALVGIAFGIGFVIANNVLNLIASLLHGH